MTKEELAKITRTAPKSPGIYLFYGPNKKPLYIGKAFNLKNRLKNYLSTDDNRILTMMKKAVGVKITTLDSDIEALILESQLIKKHFPPFNIVMRDDKQYFYVGFTDDLFSRIFLTHQPDDGEKFIGPFTDGTALKATLRYLRKIFPYCTCKQQHNNFCLNYHMEKCLGFCCLKNNVASPEQINEYEKNVSSIKGILNGKKNNVTASLMKEMKASAEKHEFEKAMDNQRTINRLEKVFKNAQIIQAHQNTARKNSLNKLLGIKKPVNRIEGYDVSNIQGIYATGSMVTFVNGQPDKNYYRKFNIKTVIGANDTAMLEEILGRRLNHEEWPFPDLILIDGGKGQVNTVLKALKKRGLKMPVAGIAKDEHHLGKFLVVPGRNLPHPLNKLSPTDRNLLLHIDSEAHRFAISHYRRLHGNKLRN